MHFPGCATLTLSAYCLEHELYIAAEGEVERAQRAGSARARPRSPRSPARDRVKNDERATRATERLRRRIEETRAIAGHTLRCSDCARRSSGRATGWTMRLGEDGRLYAFCPECDRLEFA